MIFLQNKKLEIFNSYFRNKDLSFNNKSLIIFDPYFSMVSNLNIEDINLELFKRLDYKKIITSKNLIRKINSKNVINFKSKKFSGDLIDEYYSTINLAYGRLNYQKSLKIADSFFKCLGSINLLDELSLLSFDCAVSSKDKRKFLKKFSVNYKNKKEIFDLNVTGNLSFINKKVNFKSITSNNYKASKEDLLYFKYQFENILFKEDFFDIFNLKKIKNFIIEIS